MRDDERQTLLDSSLSPESIQSTSYYASFNGTNRDVIANVEQNEGDGDRMDSITSSAGRISPPNPAGYGPQTLYERKCELVDLEVDRIGMGRYQWYLWSLCGLGFLADLLWAQAMGLVVLPMQQELGFGDDRTGTLSMAFNSGLTIGAIFWGILIDFTGRKWAFYIPVLIPCLFGTFLAMPNGYTSILVFAGFIGFGVGGNIPVDTTITLESTPHTHRYLLPLLSIFQPVGVVLCSATAYGFIPNYSCSPNFSETTPLPACNTVFANEPCCTKSDNMGWRYLLYTLSLMAFLILFLRSTVLRFQESPKFLIHRGRDKDAVQVLQYVAEMNGKTSHLTLEKLEILDNEWDAMQGGRVEQLRTPWKEQVMLELNRFRTLFSSLKMARVTILVWLTYICDYSGFTIAGTLWPAKTWQ
jgi:MFS family permease